MFRGNLTVCLKKMDVDQNKIVTYFPVKQFSDGSKPIFFLTNTKVIQQQIRLLVASVHLVNISFEKIC